MKRPAHHRSYSDQEKATALTLLRANGGLTRRTSRQTGIPEPTLICWKHGQGIHADVLRTVEERKCEMARYMEEVVWAGLSCLPEKLAKASARDIAISIAILVDKMSLLLGHPTTIVAREKMSDEELFSELSKLVTAIKDRAAQLQGTVDNQEAR